MSDSYESSIVSCFQEEGFALIGFLSRESTYFGNWISQWLSNGFNAEMKWMEKHRSLRANPCNIEEWCNTIITAAFPYYTESNEKWKTANPISNYAWGHDYHTILKKKLNKIIAHLQGVIPDFKGRACVDSAPLPEKILATASGLGWIGKNSMLINSQYGSYLFLCEIATNVTINAPRVTKNRCGNCVKCIEACPTGAIKKDSVIDSRRCISYLTIEKRGPFTEEESSHLQFQIFGCDICQQCCPWNKKLKPQQNSPFECDEKWLQLDLDDFASMTSDQFDRLKINSPIKRAKLDGITRNALAIKKAHDIKYQ